MFSTVCLVVSLFSSLVESWNNEVTVKTTVLSQSSMSDYISFMVRYGVQLNSMNGIQEMVTQLRVLTALLCL